MSEAYATLANGGTHYEPECIEQILDRKGNVIVDNTNPTGERVVSPEVAHATVEVMKGVVTSGTGTAARLSNGQEAAGKTGTTEYEQDSWFCGITPQYSVAIWLGERAENYVDAKPIYTTDATSTFSDFLNRVLANASIEKFPDAEDPTYNKSFKDEKNHIGGYASSSSSLSSASSSSGLSAGAGDSGSSSSSMGSSSAGDAGGSTGGGDSSGGSTGGGDSGGGDAGSGGETGGGDAGSGGETGAAMPEAGARPGRQPLRGGDRAMREARAA